MSQIMFFSLLNLKLLFVFPQTWKKYSFSSYPFTPLFMDLCVFFLSQSFSIKLFFLFFYKYFAINSWRASISLRAKGSFFSLPQDYMLQIQYWVGCNFSKRLIVWDVLDFCLWFLIYVYFFTHKSDLILKKKDAYDAFFYNL